MPGSLTADAGLPGPREFQAAVQRDGSTVSSGTVDTGRYLITASKDYQRPDSSGDGIADDGSVRVFDRQSGTFVIPALLVSLTAGITVTRVTSEDSGTLGHDIVEQLGGEPRTLQVAAAVLAGLALVPGFPAMVFLAFAGILGTVSVLQGAAAGFMPRRPFRPPAPPPRTGRWRFW